MTSVLAVPCQHIADYYRRLWEERKCLAWKLLRVGYAQAAVGSVEEPFNNLWEYERSAA